MRPNPDIVVRHEPGQLRFVATVDGHECVVKYTLGEDVMRIYSTQVPDPVGNRGIAAALTEAALRYAELHGLGVDPVGPYTAAYLRRRERR